MKNFHIGVFGLVAALASTVSVAAGTQNGSFEAFNTGSADVLCPQGSTFCAQFNAGNTGINGWAIGGDSVDVVGPLAWKASNGDYSLDLSGVGAGSLSQVIATFVGQAYRVSFDLGGNFFSGPSVKTGTVSAAGFSQNLSFDNSNSTKAAMGWVPTTFDFIATGGSTTLSFSSTVDGSAGLALDNVRVAAVPEPETLFLMLVGLGFVGCRALRRQSV
ncbi:choice-of-anchor C family protein [Paucibacter sp. B2R-40]|uniref:choice-of-anchor C family PEP-CTERM protein n=1 Tax=Paucibacter sp. B2R-40 TaxID=2893554 RepID=UPI0021E3B0B6|nr:choice-of-anchor C family protein [Paucibacter sp. B2R-40]MCV2354331.1 choice-of-anchor C family protein [Paucibacter sp. B2R-40]